MNKLYEADKNLFKWEDKSVKNYSGRCGKVDYRQPVVITGVEKDHIDSKHKGSYTGYVKTGSTEELKDLNFYICPKIWCAISRVTMTPQDYEKNGCPKGEEAMFFPSKSSKRNYFLTSKGTEEHWPRFLDTKSPSGHNLPCCGKTKTTDTFTDNNTSYKPKPKETNNRYVATLLNNTLLEENKHGNLSNSLSKLLGNTNACTGILDNKTECFVRTGVRYYDPQTLFQALTKCLGFDIKERILNELSLTKFIFVNQGNSCKIFMNIEDKNKIKDKKEFDNFKLFMLNDEEYIKTFNLQKLKLRIDSMDRFDILPDDIYYEIILKHYLLFKSYLNFKMYIMMDEIEKTMNDIYNILMMKWFNPLETKIIFIEMIDDNLYVLNPKYFSITDYMNKYNRFSIIIKNGSSFEYVSKLEIKNKIPITRLLFEYNEIKSIIQPIMSETKMDNSIEYGKDFKIVLSTNFKCIGYCVNEYYIPTFTYNEINYNKILNSTFIYAYELGKYKINEEKIKEYTNVKITQEQKKIIESNIISDINLSLFVSDVNKYLFDEYEEKLYQIAKDIDNTKKARYDMILHVLNPLTLAEKKELMEDMVKGYIDNKDKWMKTRLIDDLVYIRNRDIIFKYENTLERVNADEILLTINDIIKDALIDMRRYIKNEFRKIDIGYDDYVFDVDKIILDDEVDSEMYKIESDERQDITPTHLKMLLEGYRGVTDVMGNNDIFTFFSSISDKNIIELKDGIDKRIEKLYKDDDKKMIRWMMMNPSGVVNGVNKKTSLMDILKLRDSDNYSMSLFELKVLGDLTGYNICILGRETKRIPNGVVVYGDDKKHNYVLFNYVNNTDTNKDDLRLIVNIKDSYIFTLNDFEENFIKLLKLFAL